MKVEDLYNLKEKYELNRDLFNTYIDNEGYLKIQMLETITNNDEIEFHYCWYDHLSRIKFKNEIKAIEKSLNEHNWENFKIYYYNENAPCDLPSRIFIFIKEKDIMLGVIRLTQETFELIDSHEYECG